MSAERFAREREGALPKRTVTYAATISFKIGFTKCF
jgi:hypothetical protein